MPRTLPWAKPLAAAVVGAAALAVAAYGITQVAGRRAAVERLALSESIEFLEGRLAAGPYNHVVGYKLAGFYTLRFELEPDVADLRRAEEVIRGLLPAVPSRAVGLARLSLIQVMRHEFPEALAAARAAVAADGGEEAASAALFDAALVTGHYTLAESALTRLKPRSLPRMIREARWLEVQGQSGRAQLIMQRVCRRLASGVVRPQLSAWCLTRLADLEHQGNGPEAAQRWLRAALRLDPTHRRAIEGLADLARAQGQWRRAERLYRRVLSDAHPDLSLRLAEVRRAVGEPDEARRLEAEFLRVAEAPGAEALYAHELAIYLAGRRETRDRALDVVLRDIARRPAAEGYEVLAWVQWQRGDLAAALAASDSARGWGAPSPTSDYHRARILQGLGRCAEARALYARALADPTLLAPHALEDSRAMRGSRRRPVAGGGGIGGCAVAARTSAHDLSSEGRARPNW